MQLRSLARKLYSNTLLENETVWRHGLNWGPSNSFSHDTRLLDAEASRVVADLNVVGAARTTLEALTGDRTLLGRLQAESLRLEEAKRDEIDGKSQRLGELQSLSNGRSEKEFLVTLLNTARPSIAPDGLFAHVALHDQIKGVADTYFQMRTRVADINIWMNLPTDREPVASQLWHRDLPEDHFVFKMFVYLEDVEEGCGPFSYVKHTHRKGSNYKWTPEVHWDGFNWRATDANVSAATSADQVLQFPAPAGTVLFADTTGWHKGGQATTKRRVVLQNTFSSQAALPDRRLALPDGYDGYTLPWELRYDTKAMAQPTKSFAIPSSNR